MYNRLGDSLDDAFAKWDQFLQTISAGYPAFLTALTETMVNEVAITSVPDPNENVYCEGIYMWLDHILKSTQWKASTRVLSLSYIITVCNETQNHWTNLLRDNLQPDDVTSISGSQADTTKKVERTDDLKNLKKYGWESLDIWDSRPLGVV